MRRVSVRRPEFHFSCVPTALVGLSKQRASVVFISEARHLFVFFPLLLLLLLSACTSPVDESTLDPVIFKEDGVWDKIQRQAMPELYWRGKVAHFEAQTDVVRQAFHQARVHYHDLLRQRHEAISALIPSVQKQGGDLRVMRRQIMTEFRERIRVAREQSRVKAKLFRKQMMLLQQVQEGLRQSRFHPVQKEVLGDPVDEGDS
ncbi:MAG: hypothetical protein HQL54_05825 [Magnetococcales bacterium]|nr:hypothetical protein [Magnetococcales bacterium]